LALVQLIDEKYVSASEEFKPIDIGRKAQYFTIDVLTSLAFGKSSKTLKQTQITISSSRL
jgi:hypothetical protein